MPRASPKFRLYLLGSFRLERDKRVLKLPTHKTESLLAFLTLFPEAHSREKLAGQFWGDSSDVLARGSLRKALTLLRQQLGNNFLIAERETIQLNPDFPIWVDTKEIFDLRFSISESANANYADLLPDFYDDWVAPERERLRTRYVDALLRLTQDYRSRSEYDAAIQLAGKILTVDRANERAHQHLMFCYLASGNRDAALKQYEQCQRTLREELGVEPSADTIALYQWIRQASSETRVFESRITNLPIPLSSFVGRKSEMAQLKQLIAASRLVTLTGAGGSGKTRLAIQTATDLIDSFKDGVWWVELAALSDPLLVPNQIAKGLGVKEIPRQPLTETLVHWLQPQQLLLVLDNCEHLIAASAQMADRLLGACPHLKILATSREALRIDGEMAYRVASLSVPETISLAELLLSFDSIRLFVERARANKPGFALNDQNAALIAQICQRLDGIPLAIELATARVTTLSLDQIAARLDDRLNVLTRGSRMALPRQQTLRATIDWSYDLLSELEKILFNRLSVFASGWTLEAAETVCASEELGRSQVYEILSRLVDKSLIIFQEPPSAPRYGMLETIRQYAREKLLGSGESVDICTRHLDFFLKFAEEAEPKLRGPEQMEWLERLDFEHDNLRAALKWSLGEGRVEKGLQLAAALIWFWDMRQYWSEGLEHVEGLLIQPEAAPRTLTRANALLVAANNAGYFVTATMNNEYLEELVAIAREHGVEGKRTLALGLVSLSNIIFGDDPAAAESMVEEGLAIARALGDTWVLALSLYLKGSLFLGRKNHPAARKAFEESLTWFKSVGDQQRAATVSWQMSRVIFREGEFARARQELEQILPFFRQTKNLLYVWRTLNVLGEIARAEGRYDLAKGFYLEGLALARKLGINFELAIATRNVGYIVFRDGDVDYARSLFAESLALLRDIVDARPQKAFALIGFASIATAENQARRAVRLLAVVAKVLELGDKRTVTPASEAEYERNLAIAREQLDEAAFNAAWEEGKAMTLEQAVEHALEQEKPGN